MEANERNPVDRQKAFEVWKNLILTALKIPGAKINRDEYLRRELSKYIGEEQVNDAIARTPALSKVDRKTINKIADSAINLHLTQVTTLGALAGIPGGWWVAGTIPLDLTQFFYNVIQLLQKMAYIYGWPDFFEKTELDDETILKISIFVGVMFGSVEANKLIADLSRRLAEQVGKRLPQMPLTKYGVYNLAKKIATWIGIKLTKDSFAKVVAKLIPIIGAVANGTISYFTMRSMALNLKTYLSSLPLALGEINRPEDLLDDEFDE
ncbi:MAG: EcsC family protein [Clostridia bacterium]